MFENCVILAGGKSSRMGFDKSLMPFLNEPSLAHFCQKNMSRIFKNVFISAKNQKFDPPLNLIYDLECNKFSPMIALKSILSKFDQPVFILPVDMPFVDEKIIENLAYFKESYDVVIAQCGDKKHNLCGFFSPNLLTLIQKFCENNEHKISKILDFSCVKVVKFNDERFFANLNTKDEYEKALKLFDFQI